MARLRYRISWLKGDANTNFFTFMPDISKEFGDKVE
jgi:hypothetical protein